MNQNVRIVLLTAARVSMYCCLLQGDELAKPGAVRALRCQLRRANPFYADTPAPASQLAPKPLQVGSLWVQPSVVRGACLYQNASKR
jgi:hypothetical protein